MPDSIPPHTPPAGTAQRPLQRWRGTQQQQVDVVAEEVPMALRYNDAAFAVMMATPCDLEDFALGFSLSEGLISAPSQLLSIDIHPQLEGIELQMTVDELRPAQTSTPTRDACCPAVVAVAVRHAPAGRSAAPTAADPRAPQLFRHRPAAGVGQLGAAPADECAQAARSMPRPGPTPVGASAGYARTSAATMHWTS